MSFPAYANYKDSGVEWIGPIPTDWAIEPLKVAYSVVGGATPKSEIGDYWDGGVPWVTPGDLSRLTTPFIGETIRTISEEGLASCAASRVPTDSVILSTRAPIGSLGITTEPAAMNQGCKALVAKGDASPRFLAYTLSIATRALNVRGKGTTFLELSGDELARFKVPAPSPTEQSAITDFLDQEIGKIDALVEAQRRLIELLKEKRQAVISHTVTKGLDPNAPMKDSGVQWLGEVPAHWDMKRLKRLSPSITVGIVVNPSTYVASDGLPFIYGGDIREGEIDFLNCRRISEEASASQPKTKLETGDLLTVRVGAPGVTAVVPPECAGGNCASVMLVRKGEYPPEWLCHVMNSRFVRFQVEVVQYGAAQEQFNIGHAVEFAIPTPPIAEAEALANHLARELSKLQELVSAAEAATTLLQERRSALISAAVTGKIEVRGFVPEQRDTP